MSENQDEYDLPGYSKTEDSLVSWLKKSIKNT